MLSLLTNNLHIKLYSGVSIGVINILGAVNDFNVFSTLIVFVHLELPTFNISPPATSIWPGESLPSKGP